MKYLFFAKMICAFLLLCFTACTTVKTIYLQNVELTGPIVNTPIHITDSTKVPAITISPKFSFNTTKHINGYIDGHTNVNQNGVFQVDTILNSDGTITYRESAGANSFGYTGENLTWNFSSINAGLDIDLKFSNNFALFTGISYSSKKGKSTLGGNAGIGILSFNNGFATRIDLGINIQSVSYDARNVVVVDNTTIFGGSSEYVLFYRDIGEKTHIDPFISLTFNSSVKQWFLNFFLNAGYSMQSIVDFEPSQPDPFYYPFLIFPHSQVIIADIRGESTAGFFIITPGVYFNFGGSNRIIVGTGIYIETQIERASSNLFILPMIKVDLLL